MSISKEIYIGTYIEMLPHSSIRDKKTWTCKCQKRQYHQPVHRFCGKCGDEFDKQVIEEKYIPRLYDLMGEDESLITPGMFNDSLRDDQPYLVIANECYRGEAGDFEKSDDFDEDIQIDGEMVENDLSLFKSYYKRQIDHLSQQCQLFEIKFGIIKYYW